MESRFESYIIPLDIGKGFWDSYPTGFWSRENTEDCGKLFGNYQTGLGLSGEESVFPLVLWNLLLGLKLGENLCHPVDIGPVLSLHQSVGLLLLQFRARYQSRDCT